MRLYIERERNKQSLNCPGRHKRVVHRYPTAPGSKPKKVAGCAGMLCTMTPVLCKTEW